MKTSGSFILLIFLTYLTSSFCIKKNGNDFNINQPNYQELNAKIIEFINTKRLKRDEPELSPHPALQKTAEYFTSNFKLRKFQQLISEQKIMEKKAKTMAYQFGYTNTLLTLNMATTRAIDYKGGTFHFDGKDTETNSHLFYGNRPSKKEKEDPSFKLFPIHDFSLEELAESIASDFLRDRRSTKALNEGYTNIGCSTQLEKNTLNRQKIPQIKAIFVLGGKRLNF
jgi:hypothetical protein